VRLVDEDLLASIVGDDKPEPLARVEPFDCVNILREEERERQRESELRKKSARSVEETGKRERKTRSVSKSEKKRKKGPVGWKKVKSRGPTTRYYFQRTDTGFLRHRVRATC
jgi:hypothetical protein